jgi:hypothetical protein
MVLRPALRKEDSNFRQTRAMGNPYLHSLATLADLLANARYLRLDDHL